MKTSLSLAVLPWMLAVCVLSVACSAPAGDAAAKALAERNKENANLKMYSQVWDEIVIRES